MLGMLINPANMPWAPSAWKIWVDHIVKQKERFGFTKAAMLYNNGATASATSGFRIRPQELLTVKKLFEIHPDKRPESVSVQGKTYVIKYVTERQLVAFNGNKYLIVCRAKTMCVLAICESRDKCGDAAHWLTRINKRLMEKDF